MSALLGTEQWFQQKLLESTVLIKAMHLDWWKPTEAVSVLWPNIFVSGFFCHSSLFPRRNIPTFPCELEALPLIDTGHIKQMLDVVSVTIWQSAVWLHMLEGWALYPDSSKSLGANGAAAGGYGEFFWSYYRQFILVPKWFFVVWILLRTWNALLANAIPRDTQFEGHGDQGGIIEGTYQGMRKPWKTKYKVRNRCPMRSSL